jgi:hypothetical protein
MQKMGVACVATGGRRQAYRIIYNALVHQHGQFDGEREGKSSEDYAVSRKRRPPASRWGRVMGNEAGGLPADLFQPVPLIREPRLRRLNLLRV